MFQYEARLLRVVDGDTIVADVDLGFRIRIEQVIRLAHVNAPDVVNYGAAGVNDPAKTYIETHCGIGALLILSTLKSEKYGRWLAEVYYHPGAGTREQVQQSPLYLNRELLDAGLVQEYEGGRK